MPCQVQSREHPANALRDACVNLDDMAPMPAAVAELGRRCGRAME
jgi:hypothetical protein